MTCPLVVEILILEVLEVLAIVCPFRLPSVAVTSITLVGQEVNSMRLWTHTSGGLRKVLRANCDNLWLIITDPCNKSPLPDTYLIQGEAPSLPRSTVGGGDRR